MNNKQIIKTINEISQEIKSISTGKDENISLGNNCLMSFYLKSCGMKKNSYPFDWVFSDYGTLTHCFDSNFKHFLSNDYIIDKKNKAGHTLYHRDFFNHKNPISSTDNYEYYKRCVSRIKQRIKADENLFFINIIRDHENRLGWSRGFFNENHKKQRYSDYIELARKLKNNSFIFIETSFGHDEFTIKKITSKENYVAISINFKGISNGVKIFDTESEKHFKTLLKSIDHKV